jgi:hypothetical protein
MGIDTDQGAHNTDQGERKRNDTPYNLCERVHGGPTRGSRQLLTSLTTASPISLAPSQHQMFQFGSMQDYCRFAFHFIMTQMSAKAGIRKHGRASEVGRQGSPDE